MALVIGLLCPMMMCAQQDYDGNKGLFGRGNQTESNNRNRGVMEWFGGEMERLGGGMVWLGGGMIAQDPTEESPLGSGLFILMTIGAGYALLKRKDDKR